MNSRYHDYECKVIDEQWRDEMQASRIIKTIEHTELPELTSYLGQKVEIIILPISEKEILSSEYALEAKRGRFFEILEQQDTDARPWTLEEL
jgi:hypothetical protein